MEVPAKPGSAHAGSNQAGCQGTSDSLPTLISHDCPWEFSLALLLSLLPHGHAQKSTQLLQAETGSLVASAKSQLEDGPLNHQSRVAWLASPPGTKY